MNKRSFSLVLAFSFLAPVAASAGGAPAVAVTFDHPENFADVKDAFIGSDKGRDDILAQIKQFIESRTASYLQPGQHLEITFTDIDLAGDFEPAGGTQFDRVRVMKGVYPPRLSFEFKLTAANGQVLKEGKRKLMDLGYQQRMLRGGLDSDLRYEEDLLIDWMHDDLAAAKAGAS